MNISSEAILYGTLYDIMQEEVKQISIYYNDMMISSFHKVTSHIKENIFEWGDILFISII